MWQPTGIVLSPLGRSSLGKRFSLNFAEEVKAREMGGHAHSHRSGAEALSVSFSQRAWHPRSNSKHASSFSSCLVTQSRRRKRHPPRRLLKSQVLTSRFEQEQEMKRQEAIRLRRRIGGRRRHALGGSTILILKPWIKLQRRGC